MKHSKHIYKRDIQEWMINKMAIEFNMPLQHIDVSKPFTHYGLGSLQAVEFTSELEEWLGNAISPTVFFEYDNIEKLSNFLAATDKNATEISITKANQTLDHTIQKLINYKNQIDKVAGTPLFFQVTESVNDNYVQIQNTSYTNFTSYNYLDFSGNKNIKRECIKAINKYGTSVSGSRLIGGEKPIHQQLEEALSEFLQTEACLVFNSGHATNVTTIGHLMNAEDLILLDKLSHNSLVQGAMLSRATIKFFEHNDLDSLEQLLIQAKNHYKNTLIITEGIFSMDGDIPPLPEMIALKEKYHALLYVDEAHSIGVLGNSGGGIQEYFNLNPGKVDILMGTLSKSFASCGGYIASNRKLVNYLQLSAPGFVYSCGISPANTAASLAAINQLKLSSKNVKSLHDKSNYMLNLLKNAGINTGKSQDTPIIPIIIGDSMQAIKLCVALKNRQIFTAALFYPAVEENAARLRLFITASHTKKQLELASQILIEEMKNLELLA